MPLPLANSDLSRGRFEAAPPPEPPAPGFFEGIAATYHAQAADHVGAEYDNQVEAYGPLVDALIDKGAKASDYQVPFAIQENMGYASRPVYLWDKVWADAKRLGVEGLPDSQADFDRQWQARARARVERAQATAARAGWAPWLLGGLGAGFTDETTLYTIGAGGFGSTVWRKIASEALVNGLIAATENPLINAARRQQGRPEMTFGEEAANVGLAAGVGGLIRSGIEAPGVVGRAVEKNWNVLPEPLRQRWQAAALKGAAADWSRLAESDPALLADVTTAIVGRQNLSEAEAAFADQLRRAAQHDAANPFAGDGAGTELHDQLMNDALEQALAEHPEATPRAATAAPTAPVMAEAIPGAAERFMQRVRGVESGGDDAVRSAVSSAAGRYQFTDGTWLAYYKRRFGSGGLSDAQILARKGDGAMQDRLMADLTADNAAALRRAGIPPSEGNLYLAHFAGPEGARKVLQADPDAPLEALLGAKAIEANPFLRGKTAGWLSAWANRKMGSSATGGARLVEGLTGDAAEAARIQDALDAAQGRAAQLAEAERQVRASQGLPDLGEEAPAPDAAAMDLTPDLVPVERELPADHADTVPGPLLEELRAIVKDPAGGSLNKLAPLAERVDASEEAVRRALDRLAGTGELRLNAKGQYLRHAGPASRGPDDMLRFIARNGGLEPNGLGAAEVARIERDGGTVKGHDLRNTGHLDRFVPGAGPLLRKSGLGLDAMIERLHDGGYFGPPEVTPRPTESEFITLLDDTIRTGEKRYSFYDAQGAAPEARGLVDPDEEANLLADFRNDLETIDPEAAALLDGDLAHLATDAALLWSGSAGRLMDPVSALEEAAARAYAARVADFAEDLGDDIPFDASHAPAGGQRLSDAELDALFGPGEDGGQHGAVGGRRTAEPGIARESGTAGPVAGDTGEAGPPLAELPREARSPFADPDSPAIKAQADSLEHDARAALDRGEEADPALAERQRQEAQLAAEAPLRGENVTGEAQDGAANMDPANPNLFDAADAPGFRFDVEGETRSLKDALDAIDAEAAELKAIKDCL